MAVFFKTPAPSRAVVRAEHLFVRRPAARALSCVWRRSPAGELVCVWRPAPEPEPPRAAADEPPLLALAS